MASATPKPDMVARARAAAESPNVTITEEDLMEEGWLKAYSEAYFEFHPEDRRHSSQPVSSYAVCVYAPALDDPADKALVVAYGDAWLTEALTEPGAAGGRRRGDRGVPGGDRAVSLQCVQPAAIDAHMTYTLRPGTGEEPLAKEPLAKEPPAEAHAD